MKAMTKLDIYFLKLKYKNMVPLLFFLLLPLIPAFSLFIGTFLEGLPNFNLLRSEPYTLKYSFKLALIIYFSLSSFIVIMSAYIAWVTQQIHEPRGFMNSLNYCTYLSIPFSLIGITLVYPNFILVGLAFSVAITYSFHLFTSTVCSFLGFASERRLYFIAMVVFFFFSLVGLYLSFILTTWPEYFKLFNDYVYFGR